MWDECIADLLWAAKATLRAACAICGGGLVLALVKLRPDDEGSELHTLKRQACAPTDSRTIDRQIANSLGAT